MCTIAAMQSVSGGASPLGIGGYARTTPQGGPVPGALSDPSSGLDIYDYSHRYNTILQPDEEAQYQAWAQSVGRNRDPYDYDLRGFWKDGGHQSDNGHLGDLYKKPNHPTFSDQSMYHGADGAQGGHWGDGDFTPSEHNLQMFTPQGLQRYFDQREPDTRLILPGNGG